MRDDILPRSVFFISRKLESEVLRETFLTSFHLFVKALRGRAIDLGEICIENDLLASDTRLARLLREPARSWSALSFSADHGGETVEFVGVEVGLAEPVLVPHGIGDNAVVGVEMLHLSKRSKALNRNAIEFQTV